MRNDLHLCSNCLQGGANDLPVGHEKGPQIDPYRDTIPLCRECATALTGGDLGTFAMRYRQSRNISRDDGFTVKSGDSAGGPWAQIIRGDAVVATVYDPDLIARVMEVIGE